MIEPCVKYLISENHLKYINKMLADLGKAYKKAMPDSGFSIKLEEAADGYIYAIDYGRGNVTRHHFDTSAQTFLDVLRQAIDKIRQDTEIEF